MNYQNIKSQLIGARETFSVISLSKEMVKDEQKVVHLLGFILSENSAVSDRACWVLRKCFDLKPEYFASQISKMIIHLKKAECSDPLKRNFLHIIGHSEIPEKNLGTITNICFDWLIDFNQKVATRAFSLHVLGVVCEKEPGLIPELTLIMNEQWNYESPAFRSKAKKLLKKFKVEDLPE